MRTNSCGIIVVLVGLALGGCCVNVGGFGTNIALASFHPEPPYRTELIAFDEGLIGRWNEPTEANSRSESLVFSERTTYATEGRISNPPPLPMSDRPPGSSSVRVYCLTSQARQASEDPTPAMYDAVLLKIDGETFLGIQRMFADLPMSGPFIGSLPVHQIVKIERSGGSLVIRRPTNGAVWIPLFNPVDERSSTQVAPPVDGSKQASDADRLIESLKLANKTPGSWSEPITLRRVE